MEFRTLAGGVFAIAISVAVTQPASANLLQNGDFASGDFTDWNHTSGVFVFATPALGTAYVAQNGTLGSTETLSQQVHLTAGQYLFGFDYGNGFTNGQITPFYATVPGGTRTDGGAISVPSPTALKSATWNLSIVAEGDYLFGVDLTLFLPSVRPSRPRLSLAVTNLSLTDIPEPATALLVGGAMAGLAVARRKRLL